MLTRVVNIQIINGDDICEFWELPMVVITTTNGKFIDFAKNFGEWRKSIGKEVTIKQERCWRKPKYTWAYLR